MKVLLAVSALAVVMLMACGSDDEPLAAGDGHGGTIEGEYRSVEVTEDGTHRSLVDDSVIALRLAEGDLSASAGCNSMSGPYAVVDGVLDVSRGLAMTEMGCDPDLMDQDTWLVEFLTARPAVEATDDGLVLTTDTTTIRFVDREIAEPDAELVGTTWTVTGFIDGDTAMSTSSDAETATLRFEDNGFVTGHDGCNSLGHADGGADTSDRVGLTYEVDGGEITFDGAPVQTDMACEDVESQERFHTVLSGTVTWEIEASKLTLLAQDGRGVTYTATS